MVAGVTVAACCCIGLAAWGIINHIQQRSKMTATNSLQELHPDAAPTAIAATPCNVSLAQSHSRRELQPGVMLPPAAANSQNDVLPNSALAAHVAASGAAAIPAATPTTSLSPIPSPVVLAAGEVDVPVRQPSETSVRAATPSSGKCSPLASPRVLISISPSHFSGADGSGLATPEEDISTAGTAAAAGSLQDLGLKARVVLLRAGERPLSPLGSPKAAPVGSPRSMPNLGGAVTVGGLNSLLPEEIA